MCAADQGGSRALQHAEVQAARLHRRPLGRMVGLGRLLRDVRGRADVAFAPGHEGGQLVWGAAARLAARRKELQHERVLHEGRGLSLFALGGLDLVQSDLRWLSETLAAHRCTTPREGSAMLWAVKKCPTLQPWTWREAIARVQRLWPASRLQPHAVGRMGQLQRHMWERRPGAFPRRPHGAKEQWLGLRCVSERVGALRRQSVPWLLQADGLPLGTLVRLDGLREMWR
mmetsp:Transcript_56398/g.157172  ORF Transcript_56398/g.157172 Transcript_56398/m.157172 type:complete len:229 (+) Transcript_56398:185-871(+)